MDGPYWIGLKFYDAQWKWVESELEPNFTYWEEGFPIDYLEPRPCVLIKLSIGEDGLWENAICDITKRILCEKTLPSTTLDTLIMTTTTTAREKTMTSKHTMQNNGCTPPWVRLLDSCYSDFTDSHHHTYDDSKWFCQEHGGHLFEINTKEEQDALKGKETVASQNYNYLNCQMYI